MVNLFWGNKIGDKRSFPGGDEKIFSGDEKLGEKNPFWG
jgi:hypothetical protein